MRSSQRSTHSTKLTLRQTEVDIETDGYYTYNMEQPVHVLDSEVKKVIGMLKLGPDYQTEPDRVEKEHSMSAPRICLGLPSHPQ